MDRFASLSDRLVLPFGVYFGSIESTPTPEQILQQLVSSPRAFYPPGSYYTGWSKEAFTAIPNHADVSGEWTRLSWRCGQDRESVERRLQSSQSIRNFLIYTCAALLKIRRLTIFGHGVSAETLEEFEQRTLNEILAVLGDSSSSLYLHQTEIIRTEGDITTSAFVEADHKDSALRIVVRKNALCLRYVINKSDGCETMADGLLDGSYKQAVYARITRFLEDNFIDLRAPLRIWNPYPQINLYNNGRLHDSYKKRYDRPIILHNIYVKTLQNLREKMEYPGSTFSTRATREARLDDTSADGYGGGV